MKILYLSQAGAIGGAEQVILDAVAAIHPVHREWRFALIAPAAGPLADEARALGVVTRVVPFPRALASLGDANTVDGSGETSSNRWWMLGRLGVSSPAIARYIRQLARAIAEIQPDVIHANGFKMHLLSAWAAPEACALLWHLHDFIGSRSLMRPLLRIHLRRCATIIANSHSVQRDALATLRAAPIQTIYNGIDLEKFAPHGDQLNLDARTGLSRPDANVMRIGLVANAARWKGHQVFLRALAALPSELLIRGYVIGGPIYQTAGSQFTMDELSRMASELDLEGKVGFTGHLREIPAAMRSLDIVVHASTRPEPFGLVVAEAMATGRPVIASASGGVSELIADGTNALAHQPGDVPGLARAIERLVTDQDLRERLSYEGRRTAEQRFDRRRMGAELAAVYDRLMVRQVRGDDAASAYS